jgi:hypothetical protein
MDKAMKIDKEAQLYRIARAAEDLSIDELTKFADGMSSLAYINRLANGENETDHQNEQFEKLMKIVKEQNAEWAILGLASCYLRGLSEEMAEK